MRCKGCKGEWPYQGAWSKGEWPYKGVGCKGEWPYQGAGSKGEWPYQVVGSKGEWPYQGAGSNFSESNFQPNFTLRLEEIGDIWSCRAAGLIQVRGLWGCIRCCGVAVGIVGLQ